MFKSKLKIKYKLFNFFIFIFFFTFMTKALNSLPAKSQWWYLKIQAQLHLSLVEKISLSNCVSTEKHWLLLVYFFFCFFFLLSFFNFIMYLQLLMSYIKEQKACFIYNGLILNLFYLFISYIKLIGDTFNTHKQAGWSGGVHFLTVWQFWGFRLMTMAPTDCSRTIKWTSQAKWFLLILNCIETLLINLVKLQVKAQEKNILNVFLRWVPPPNFFIDLQCPF